MNSLRNNCNEITKNCMYKVYNELCKYINYALTVTNKRVQYVNIKIEEVLVFFSILGR